MTRRIWDKYQRTWDDNYPDLVIIPYNICLELSYCTPQIYTDTMSQKLKHKMQIKKHSDKLL